MNFSGVEGLAITAGESLSGFCQVSLDYIKLQLWDSTGGTTWLTSAEFTASGGFMASGSYFV